MQEIPAITPYIDIEHIKHGDNMLAVSLLWLETLGLYKANDPEEPGREYGKSILI